MPSASHRIASATAALNEVSADTILIPLLLYKALIHRIGDSTIGLNPISSANGELHVHYHSALRWITAKIFKHHIGLGQIYSGVFQCFQHVVYDMNLMAAHQHLGHRLAVDEALQVQRLEMPMLLFLRLLEHSGLRMEHQTSSHFFTNSPSSQAYSAGKMKIMFTLANALG